MCIRSGSDQLGLSRRGTWLSWADTPVTPAACTAVGVRRSCCWLLLLAWNTYYTRAACTSRTERRCRRAAADDRVFVVRGVFQIIRDAYTM